MAGTKMAGRKKTGRRKFRKRAPKYRGRFIRKLEMANMKPSTAVVRFEGTKRFVFNANPNAGANAKSIIRIPANYIGNDVGEAGIIQPDNNTDLVETTAAWYAKYNHYHVLGSHCSVTARPEGTLDGQNTAICSIARADRPNMFAASSTNHDIEKAFGVKSNWTKIAGGGSSESARLSMGYLPGKTFAVKDVTDSNALRCSAMYDVLPNDRTFYNIILMGALDSDPKTHSTYIVDVKVMYTVKFSEAREDNTPTLAMGLAI